MLVLIYGILIGAIAGILAGLFGLGGGIVIVPLINTILLSQGYPAEHAMHFAIGTSLATMIFSTGASSFFNYQKKNVHWPFVKYIAPFMVLGGAIGVGLGDNFPSHTLRGVFSALCALIACSIFLEAKPKQHATFPEASFFHSLLGLMIGTCAGLAGLGGGILLVPVLARLGAPIKGIGPVSALCSLPTVFVGTLSAIYFGWDVPYQLDIPHWGYVLWSMAIVQGVTSILTAYLGVMLLHKLSGPWLKRILAGLLLLISTLMFPWK